MWHVRNWVGPVAFGLRSITLGSVALGLIASAVVDEGRPAGAQQLPEPQTYRPPVPDRVARGFDMAAGPFGAGNRGLDYVVAPATSIASIGDGVVVFNGVVAGSRWVTVLHPDQLRSTYGPLSASDVTAGRSVSRGGVIGRASGSFHLGVRRGDRYIDPAALFAGRPRHAHLIPTGWPWVRLGLIANHR